MGLSLVWTVEGTDLVLIIAIFLLYLLAPLCKHNNIFLNLKLSIFNCISSLNWDWYLSLRGGLLHAHYSMNSFLTVTSSTSLVAGVGPGGSLAQVWTDSTFTLNSSVCLSPWVVFPPFPSGFTMVKGSTFSTYFSLNCSPMHSRIASSSDGSILVGIAPFQNSWVLSATYGIKSSTFFSRSFSFA